MTRELTGRHVAAMFVGGFGIIIAVNLTMAFSAVRTFPGLEVKNSYVASQSFDARRTAQEALGWQARVAYADGMLSVDIVDRDGRSAPARGLTVQVGRPTEAADDVTLALSGGSAAVDLAPGLWRVDIRATAPDGTLYARAVELRQAP